MAEAKKRSVTTAAIWIASIITAFNVIFPFARDTFHTANDYILLPVQLRITDSIIKVQFDEFAAHQKAHDSIIQVIWSRDSAKTGNDFFAVGLRANKSGTLFYRDRYNKTYRAYKDADGNLWYYDNEHIARWINTWH